MMKREVSELSRGFYTMFFSDYDTLVDWLMKTQPIQFTMAPNIREKDKDQFPYTVSVLRKVRRATA